MGNEKRAVEVHAKGLGDVGVAGSEEGFIGCNTGGIDVDMDVAKVGFDAGDCVVHLFSRGYVCPVVLDFDTVGGSEFEEGG